MKNTSSTFLTRVRMARILFLFSVCFLSLHSYAANIGAYAQQLKCGTKQLRKYLII